MVNPAEDIVNIWLQEVKKWFTISNVVVRKGRGSRGGRGKEIDLIATDGNGKYFWIEVSVSPNPRLPNRTQRLLEITKNAVDNFVDEKLRYLNKLFPGKKFKKLFVYSPKLFSKKLNEEKQFCEELKKHEIKVIAFNDVLNEVLKILDYMGYDVTRNYLFLLKKLRD